MTEGLDCWDGYPMEHGCICGNDCKPPVYLDPYPWSLSDDRGEFIRFETEAQADDRHGGAKGVGVDFEPRPGYSQNKEDYA